VPGPFYVYTLSDVSGAVFYVGKGCRTSSNEERMHAHEKDARRGKSSRVCQRIREIWAGGGKILSVKIFVSDSASDAYMKEAEEIAKYGIGNLCNVVPGGRGGTEGNRNAAGRRTEEQKARIRAGVQNYLKLLRAAGGKRSCSMETASKIGKVNAGRGKGRKLPAEVCEKISRAGRGKTPWHAGGHLPDAMREKISLALRGRKKTIEHVAKVSAALRGRKQTPEECALRSSLLKGKPWSLARRLAHQRSTLFLAN
jgi:hypothetical protein